MNENLDQWMERKYLEWQHEHGRISVSNWNARFSFRIMSSLPPSAIYDKSLPENEHNWLDLAISVWPQNTRANTRHNRLSR